MKSISRKFVCLVGTLLTSAVYCSGEKHPIGPDPVPTTCTDSKATNNGGLLPCKYAPTVSSVTVTPPSFALSIGTACVRTSQLAVLVVGSEGVSQAGVWTLEGATVGTISTSGLFTATTAGTATARFTSDVDKSKSGTSAVAVTSTSCAPAPTVSSVTVTPPSFALSIGTACVRTSQLAVLVVGSEGVSQAGVWTVEGGVGTVSNTGLFTATTAGSGLARFTSDVDKTKSGTSAITVSGTTCVVNTRDSITVVLAPADSFDLAPSGVFVDFISTDSVSVAINSWYGAHTLSIPKGVSTGRLRIRGGSNYESSVLTVSSSAGARFAKVLHPNCWMIRAGDFAGTTKCLPKASLTAKTADGLSFWDYAPIGAMLPYGWVESLLPAKVQLSAFDAGWTAADSIVMASQINKVNQAVGTALLTLSGRVGDTLTPVGSINASHRSNNNASNTGFYTSGTGEAITSGRIIMAKDGFFGAPNVNNIAHEFMHVLGFGHTCGWITQMYTVVCKDKWSPDWWFTAEDIAGFQLSYAIRAQSKRINANISYF